MRLSSTRHAFWGLLTFTLSGFADNPLSQNYLADPALAVVGDSVLYLIADTDYDNVPDASGKVDYAMKAGYLLSTKDMKNWTDHGEIFRVPRDVSWAGGVWAPGAVWRNGQMWIYYPNGGYGVGVVSSSNPAGPYKDPIGKLLVGGNGAVSCDGVEWCFDPGVFVDTDGQAYLHWGGGKNANRPFGSNFSIVKLKSDMYTPDGLPQKMTGSGQSFEASYIHKRNGKYYLSYNTSDQKIGYSMSSSPTGPWTDMGIAMENPAIDGQNINAYNNSHHGFAEFKGKWYAAYHDRRVALAKKDANPAYHRSVSLDELQFDGDGKIKPFVYTNSGPAQIGTFNPYDSIPAVTSSLSNNVKTQSVPGVNAPVTNLLLPLPSGTNGSWLRVSGVDFGATGKLRFLVNAASTGDNNQVEIRTGSPTGPLAGTCALPNTGSKDSFVSTGCAVTGITGTVSELYLKFLGTDYTAALKWWRFENSPLVPPRQGPYDSLHVMTIPGTIEAENYDLGGEGLAFHDVDAENNGKIYRTDGVDIDSTSDGYALGWTEVGEWTEYTVEVDSGIAYDWTLTASSGIEGSAIRLYLDSLDISGSIAIPQGKDWDTYSLLKGTTQVLAAGTHILRIAIEGKYANVDRLQFSVPSFDTLPEPPVDSLDTLPDPEPPVDSIDSIPEPDPTESAQLPWPALPSGHTVGEVYNASGRFVGRIPYGSAEAMRHSLRALGIQKGLYIVRPLGSHLGLSVQVQ